MMSLASKGDDLLLLLQKFPDVFFSNGKALENLGTTHANQSIGNWSNTKKILVSSLLLKWWFDSTDWMSLTHCYFLYRSLNVNKQSLEKSARPKLCRLRRHWKSFNPPVTTLGCSEWLHDLEHDISLCLYVMSLFIFSTWQILSLRVPKLVLANLPQFSFNEMFQNSKCFKELKVVNHSMTSVQML